MGGTRAVRLGNEWVGRELFDGEALGGVFDERVGEEGLGERGAGVEFLGNGGRHGAQRGERADRAENERRRSVVKRMEAEQTLERNDADGPHINLFVVVAVED